LLCFQIEDKSKIFLEPCFIDSIQDLKFSEIYFVDREEMFLLSVKNFIAGLISLSW